MNREDVKDYMFILKKDFLTHDKYGFFPSDYHVSLMVSRSPNTGTPVPYVVYGKIGEKETKDIIIVNPELKGKLLYFFKATENHHLIKEAYENLV